MGAAPGREQVPHPQEAQELGRGAGGKAGWAWEAGIATCNSDIGPFGG